VSQDIGFYREITPCPRSGKITLRQIGAIRQITQNISCDNEELLLARKPQPTGDLDYAKNPIYALKDPTYDPSDYYSAYWGASYDVIKGESLGPNPLGDWNEQFVDPQPPDDLSDSVDAEAYREGSRSVDSRIDEDGKPYLQVSSSSPGAYKWRYINNDGFSVYEWVYYPRTAYAISYLSRVEAGDRLVFYFEWQSGNDNWYDEGCDMKIIGWRDGWMGNDEKVYASSGYAGKRWKSEIIEIEVDPSYRDIAIAFYQAGSDNGQYLQYCNFRNVHCWRA